MFHSNFPSYNRQNSFQFLSLTTDPFFSIWILMNIFYFFQLGSTFFRRLGWSPCGHFITTTHGFQKPRHSAPVLERGEWSATFDFLGHNAPVIVVKFNHSMFRRTSSNGQEVKSASAVWTNGATKIGGKESQPYNVIAIGSQDRTITVWTTASARPLFVAKHFFTQSVVDLSWYVTVSPLPLFLLAYLNYQNEVVVSTFCEGLWDLRKRNSLAF